MLALKLKAMRTLDAAKGAKETDDIFRLMRGSFRTSDRLQPPGWPDDRLCDDPGSVRVARAARRTGSGFGCAAPE